MVDIKRQVKTHGTRSREWSNTHILLVIIVLQAGFMIFMGLSGPTATLTTPDNSPNRRQPGWSSGTNTGDTGRGRNKKKHDHSHHRDAQEVPEKEKGPTHEIVKATPKLEHKKPPVTRPPKATNPPQYMDMVQVKEWEVNTEDFPGAIHLHFDRERQDPSFRHELKVDPNHWEEAEKAANKLVVIKKFIIHSCSYYHHDENKPSNMPPALRFMETCFTRTQKGKHNGIIAYNTQPFARSWCGKLIKPGFQQHYNHKDICSEPARILLESDEMLGTERADLKSLPPAVFHRNGSDSRPQFVQDCDVPCKFSLDTCTDAHGKKQKGPDCLTGVSDFTVEGTDFTFKYSMLDPRDAPEVNVMRKAYRENQFYATRSFQSEIPLSTFDWEKYGENTPHNDFKKSAKMGICFIHVEPCSGEIRPGVWAGKLKEAFKGNFDAYGPCKFSQMTMKDTELNVYDYKDRQKIMKEYMFTLVIGQSQTPDYVQDMVWDALHAGSIPVYYGAPNIREHVPPNSVITVSGFPSQGALAEHLDKVMNHRELWRNYHAWREEDTQHLEEKYGFLKEKSSSPYCRMCRLVLANRYALGWNHTTQTIQPPALDRSLCVNPKDEVKFPFLERWMSNLGVQEPKGRKICEKSSATQTMVFDDISVTRTILTHDNGVIDIDIKDIQSIRDKDKIVLRLDFHKDIQNVEGAHILHPHRLLASGKKSSKHVPLMSSIAIQDHRTRVTVLTNWATDLFAPKLESTVDVLVQDLRKATEVGPEDPQTGYRPRLAKDDARKIRIIMEDVNVLRDASTEYSISPFASVMMRDFLDPLIYFYVEEK